MAKKQSFESKLSRHRKAGAQKAVKLVYSTRSEKTGAWKFVQRFITLPIDGDENKYVDEALKEINAQK